MELIKSGKVMRSLAIVMIALSLLVVSGVEGCPGAGDAEAKSAGLVVSFVSDAPPISVNVNQEFPIYIEVLNNGGDFVNKDMASFYLSGIGPSLEGVSEKKTNERSIAKESISPERVIFAEAAKFTFPIESLHTVPLSLTACYNYGSVAQATICIAAKNKTEICEVGENRITPTSNTVAPVQVTSLTENIVGNKLRVSFTIENKLDGSVYMPDTDCDKLQIKDISESFKGNKVQVEVRSPEKGFNCKLQGLTSPYTPVDGTKGSADLGNVICEKDLTGRENYVAPFSVILRYKYVDSTLKTINILP